jgi:hypothetical protein
MNKEKSGKTLIKGTPVFSTLLSLESSNPRVLDFFRHSSRLLKKWKKSALSANSDFSEKRC